MLITHILAACATWLATSFYYQYFNTNTEAEAQTQPAIDKAPEAKNNEEKLREAAFEETRKLAKEFGPEQYAKLVAQLTSLLQVERLLKAGDIKGIFESYGEPESWADLALEVYNNSVNLNLILLDSMFKTCFSKIFEVNPVYAGYYLEYTAIALKNELEVTLNSNGAIHQTNIEIDETEIRKETVKSVKYNDHSKAVFDAILLFHHIAASAEADAQEMNIALVQENLEAFYTEYMPELVLYHIPASEV